MRTIKSRFATAAIHNHQPWLIASAIAIFCALPAIGWAESAPKSKTAESGVAYTITSRTLGEALKEIATRSGITFRLSSGLEQEKITANLSGNSWSEDAKMLLRGYNYAVSTGKNGVWETVTISGKNGDGKDVAGKQANRKAKFLRYSGSEPTNLPARYRGLKPGSVTPVTLPLATLKGMKKGKTVTLDLPSGRYSLVHDNRFNHGNGDVTWVGNLENESPAYRGMITMGKQGPMGHFATPEGDFQFFTEGGQTYLVDINASGLQSGSFLEDQAIQETSPLGETAAQTTAPIPVSFGNRAWASGATAANGSQTSSSETTPLGNPSNTTTIDLLVLSTKGLPQPDTRVNYLADLTNQAFLDSRINARIRVVHSQVVDYTDTNDNSQALSDLSSGNAPFEKIQELRNKYGADLVSLIRPFRASAQKGCGVAWVNGSNGSSLSSMLAFSVVSVGNDADGQAVYCGPHVMAHELGHNFGTVHDRPFADVPGAYAYSYAWGVEGSFGTIMSYCQPNVPLFASPLLGDACRGQPCGYPEGDPNASDDSRTINQTAPVVAGFEPTVVPDKTK